MIYSLYCMIKEKTHLHAVIRSGGWLFFDKVFRLLLGLFVGISLARYLGPERFGLLNYAMAYVAIFSVIANLGLDSIVVRDLSERSGRENLIVGTAWTLKIMGALISIIFCLLTVTFWDPTSNSLLISIVFLLSLGSIFQTADVIDFIYQARMNSKLSVITRSGAFFASSSFKLFLIYMNADLTTFAFASSLEVALAAAIFVWTYLESGGKMAQWEFSRVEALRLLREGWPLFFSGILVLLYLKIDQIMIGNMLDSTQVGIYSVAVKLTEVWYFMPVVITTAIFPMIVNLKSRGGIAYSQALEYLYILMMWLSLTVALSLTFFSEHIVQILFGNSYIEASSVVKIQCWSGIFIFSGLVSNQWYLLEGKGHYIFYRNVLGVCINVVLNIALIPKFGINGSAYATLITQIIISYLFDALSPNSRELFYLRTRVFIFFIPMTYKIFIKKRA